MRERASKCCVSVQLLIHFMILSSVWTAECSKLHWRNDEQMHTSWMCALIWTIAHQIVRMWCECWRVLCMHPDGRHGECNVVQPSQNSLTKWKLIFHSTIFVPGNPFVRIGCTPMNDDVWRACEIRFGVGRKNLRSKQVVKVGENRISGKI